jgi:hypothetical protein
MRHYPLRVENYTNAFLVTSGLILFMAFFTLAATNGFVWVMLSAALIDLGLKLSGRRFAIAEVRQNL